MVQTAIKLTFEWFLERCDGFYELLNGEIVKVEATRAHKNIARFLMFAFNDEIRRLKLDYIVDKDIPIKTLTDEGQQQGRRPDVAVVNGSLWNSDVRGYGALTEPIQLAVEVVSTNWEDDCVHKLDEYRRLGIAEYWIVDPTAIASRAYLGNPKQPTIFVYNLVENAYRVNAFRESDRLISPTFPELTLTAAEVFNAIQIRSL
jgi:Uma2 family endonuclease